MLANVTEIKNKLAVKSIENEKLLLQIKELETRLNDKSKLQEEQRKYADLLKKYEQSMADLQSAKVCLTSLRKSV